MKQSTIKCEIIKDIQCNLKIRTDACFFKTELKVLVPNRIRTLKNQFRTSLS